MKQKELSIWLRVIVALGFVCVVFLGGVIAPELGREMAWGNPELAYMFWPCLAYIWLTAVPVIIFMVLVWLIAVEIGRDNSFCVENAQKLRACSILALADTLLYIFAAVVLGAMKALHISVLLLIIGIAAIGFAVTVCCAALSHLTRKAADMKSENDLTV